MKSFKFYSLMWVITHVFVFGMIAIVFVAAGDYSQKNINDLKGSLLILFAVEVLVIGVMVGLYKLINSDD